MEIMAFKYLSPTVECEVQALITFLTAFMWFRQALMDVCSRPHLADVMCNTYRSKKTYTSVTKKKKENIETTGATYSRLHVFFPEITSSNNILSLLVVYYDNYTANYNQWIRINYLSTSILLRMPCEDKRVERLPLMMLLFLWTLLPNLSLKWKVQIDILIDCILTLMAREDLQVSRSRFSAVSLRGTGKMALWLRLPPLSQEKCAAEGGKRKITALCTDTNLMIWITFVSDNFKLNQSSVLLVLFQRDSSSGSQKYMFFPFIHLDSFGQALEMSALEMSASSLI